jgi:putative ABC transport system permease protein
LPLLDRVLIGLLLRGADLEHLIGDIVERYQDDLVANIGRRSARRRLRRQVLATCASWWSPSVVVRRLRRGSAAEAGPQGSKSRGVQGSWAAPGKGEAMSMWIQDVRIAGRSLARRPGFAVGVALTLGLGIGATTTIFSVVDGVILRQLPYVDPGRLVAVGATFPTGEWDDQEAGLQHLAGISLLNFRDFRARNRSLESVAGVESVSVLFPDMGSGPELVPAARASNELFDLLGVTPALGRTFLPGEHSTEAASVVLLSYGAWQRRFGGAPDIVGRALGQMGGVSTIVGVLPQDFRPPEALMATIPDVWMPLSADHARYASRGMRSLNLVGRLNEGVTTEQARAEAASIAADLVAEFPDGNVYPDGSHLGIGVNTLHAQTVGRTGRTLRIFVGAAALLLLLAVMNAATLLLTRGLDRVHEMGVRMALGAGRGRMVRLLMVEAGLLAAAGGAIGVALAYMGVETFLRFAPSDIPRVDTVAVDGRMLAVAGLLSLGAGVVAGLLPAVRLARSGPWGRMSASGRGTSEPGSRLRTLLVGSQMAVAVVLGSGAALLLTSFSRIVAVEPGFDPAGLVTMNISLKRPGAADEESWQGWDRAIEELASVPGVEAVAGTSNLPFQSPFWAPRLLLPGDAPEVWREGISGYSVTPGYLETMGTSVITGRGIERLDGPEAEPVALVNESFVRTQLAGSEPLGMILRQVEGDAEIAVRVVGVVEDVVQTSADQGPQAAVYVPYTQAGWPFLQTVIRSSLPADVLIPELRKAAARFSPVVPPRDVGTMQARISVSRTTPRFQALLIGSFALVALLLASIGLYGSLAHTVERRERELGVRMALGSARSGVLLLVLGQGMRVAAIGLALGVAAAWWSSQILSGFLFGVEPHDPLTLSLVAGLLLLVSSAACLIPARRATSVDPVTVLKSD